MAPPVSRRPGFSRRAYFSLFLGYIITVTGALLGLLLLFTAHFDPKGNSSIRALLGDIASPLSSAGAWVVRGAQSGASAVSAYIYAGSQNHALRTKLQQTSAKLIEGQSALLENRQLKILLKIAQTEKGPVVAAHLISASGSNSRRYAMLDKGSISGITVGQPVRAADGLLGQIMQTGAISSRVLLISDSGNIIPVQRVADGVIGVASGNGDGLLTVHAVLGSSDPFKAGDIMVTSGAGGVYPPQIAVGKIISADHDSATMRPLANPEALDVALVEPIFVAPLAQPTVITAKAKHHAISQE